jgi:L-asparagine oxygenase
MLTTSPLPVVDLDGSDALVPPDGCVAMSEDFVLHAARARRRLPAEMHDALTDFASVSSPSGALLVRGLELGAIPATPPSPTSVVDKDAVSEFTLLAAARCLGEPVGYLPEHGGDVVQNIVPVAASAARQVSTSSNVELMFHTEAAFHPHRPRYLLLLCLRGDPAAGTRLSSVRDVIGQLDPDVVDVLSDARFRTAPDESYTVVRRAELLGAPHPVLWGHRSSPYICFDADLMVGIDDDATDALRLLAGAVVTTARTVVLDAGDLLVVDNNVAVHGRTPFTPRFDGSDRWLQRTFVVADLAASAGDRVGRVITTHFA